MASYQQVLELLNLRFEPDSTDFDKIIFELQDFFGPLREKLEKRFSRLKREGAKFEFTDITYWKLDIDDLNGKQLLHLLIWLANNSKWMKAGNCFVFHVKKQPNTAVIVFNGSCIEVHSTTPVAVAERGLWDKAFDDNTRKKKQQFSNYEGLDDESVAIFRESLPKEYERYMNECMSSLNSNYVALFTGVVWEIAKCYVERWKSYEQLKNFPKASLIKLAIDNKLSGLLQSVFNEHGKTNEIKSVAAASSGKKEALENVHNHKAKLRNSAAQEIIEKVFHVNENGTYDKAKVKVVAEDVKAFYK